MKIFEDVRNHPMVSSVIAVLCAALLAFAYSEGKLQGMTMYLAAMLLAVLATDFLAARFDSDRENFEIKSPKKELIFLLAIQLVIIVMSLVRFQVFTDWQRTGIVFKLPLLVLMILFVFPVALLIVFRRWRYTLKDLGFSLRYVWFGLPVILIIGLATYFFAPEKMQFAEIYREMGLIQMILTGFIVAAIPEELTRYLLQTRLGKVLRNNAFGWLAASLLWAFIHLPNFYAQAGNQNLIPVIWSVLSIVPIGLLWGFMTHRTRSILPAVTVHGTNLWGLQN